MKKLLLALGAVLLLNSAGFANNEPTNKKPAEIKELTAEKLVLISKESAEKYAVCKISCSVVANGVTYTTSAGGWFTGCAEAGNQCLRKLAELSANLEP
jgi:hypothetical protein